jgi:hypothetical protein
MMQQTLHSRFGALHRAGQACSVVEQTAAASVCCVCQRIRLQATTWRPTASSSCSLNESIQAKFCQLIIFTL